MLALFPTLLPEEPLYSAVARYGDMMRFGSHSALHRAVSSVRQVTPSVDLPGRIEASLGRLLPGHGYTAAEVIERHTAVPYSAAFLPQARVAPVERMLRETHGRTAATRFGRGRELFRPVRHLRFCDACVAEDRGATHGCAYWCRIHQLPGVVVYPTHGCSLAVSGVDLQGREDARTFVSLERALAKAASVGRDSGGLSERPGDALPLERRNAAMAIAVGSLWLLQHGPAVHAANLSTAVALRERY